MRKPRYISASSLSLFEESADKYVQRYVAEPYVEGDGQTIHMALGSGFDAFIKNELYRCKYGGKSVKIGQPNHLETLFNNQVDEEHREWCWHESGHLFLKYKDSGAFDELLEDMEGCKLGPFMEHEIYGPITLPNGTTIIVRGFIDLFYLHRNNYYVVVDFKVNNFKGRQKKSPQKHYILERPTGRTHKHVEPVEWNGMVLQDQHCFSECDKKWATQLAIYSWSVGVPVGEETPVQIEQILVEPEVETNPDARCITYRGFVSSEFQLNLAERLSKLWECIQEENYFPELSEEESQIRIDKLELSNQQKASESPLVSIINGVR